ncbi:MAG: HEAT repeat domain-containing protein [Alphaproteobacteria bacterium]|nr:HEAT repeat domain-containing protein [Alphaproteobacteria bacterium]
MIRRALAAGTVLMLTACAPGHRPFMEVGAAEAALHGGTMEQRREAALSFGRWAQERADADGLRIALPALAAAAARDGEHIAGPAVWAWGKAARAARPFALCNETADVAAAGVFKGALFRRPLAKSAALALAVYPECGMAAAKALLVVMEQAHGSAVKRQAAGALAVILALEVTEEVEDFAAPRLDAAQESEDGELRLLAAQARVAMEIGLTPRADMAEPDKIADVLQLALQEEDIALKAAAVRVFAQLEMAFSLDLLMRAAADEATAVRLAAVDGMARNEDSWEYMLPMLRRMAEEDASPLVRQRTAMAVKQLMPAAEKAFLSAIKGR